LHKAMTLAPPLEDVPWQDNVLIFPQMPSSTCTVLIEKWVRFKLTEFKNFWRTIPDVENSSFVMTDNPNFNIFFSILPGLLQHPSLKMESTSNGLAEQAIMLLKSISTKYCSVILGW